MNLLVNIKSVIQTETFTRDLLRKLLRQRTLIKSPFIRMYFMNHESISSCLSSSHGVGILTVPASEDGVWMTVPTASDVTVYQYIEVTAEDGERAGNVKVCDALHARLNSRKGLTGLGRSHRGSGRAAG